MLCVNAPKPNVIIENFDYKTYEGVTFHVIKSQGMSVFLSVDGDENKGKTIVKSVASALPEMKYKVVSVMIVDEAGRVI